MGWIKLAQDGVQWQTLVNMVINLWILTEGKIFLGQLRNCQLLKDTTPCMHIA